MALQHIHTVHHEFAPQCVEILRDTNNGGLSLRLIDDGIHQPLYDVDGVTDGIAEDQAYGMLVEFNRTV